MELTGEVSSGLGRAHVFMAQPHYQDQFRQMLGATAWPGTLNLRVEASMLSHYIALRQKAGIDTLDAPDEARQAAKDIDVGAYDVVRIRGFLRDGVSFGGATAFHGTVHHHDEAVPCALLIPDLTRHVDVIELISPTFLREHLSLSDGDRLTVSL
jgi:CTP-dependent riboflavin kinase